MSDRKSAWFDCTECGARSPAPYYLSVPHPELPAPHILNKKVCKGCAEKAKKEGK